MENNQTNPTPPAQPGNWKMLAAFLGVAVVIAVIMAVSQSGADPKTAEPQQTDAVTAPPDDAPPPDSAMPAADFDAGDAMPVPGDETTIAPGEPQAPEGGAALTAADDTYTAEVPYAAPRGVGDSVTVSLTVNDRGVITAADVEYVSDHEISGIRQAAFDAAYKDFVIGQPLDRLDLSVVGGSSLTTAAFMEAVEKIRADRPR
jgi:hypothetical protein